MWDLSKSKAVLSKTISVCPSTLIMLGSGWNHALELTKIETRISYHKLFGVKTSVPGHQGEIVVGRLAGKRVLFMSGRFHLYEGYSGDEATGPIALFASQGVKRVIVTSASGALNPLYRVGDFVVLSDVLTLFLRSNPLMGPQFVDMSAVFDEKWRGLAIARLKAAKLPYREGIYAYMSGPHYETPADKRALLFLGADCVGMSTVPEIIMARKMGLSILGLSLITNLAFVKHDHQEVMAAAKESARQMATLISQLV